MTGMQSAVTRDVPPFTIAMGSPARPTRLNTYRLDKLGVPADAHEALAGVVLGDSRDTSGLPDTVRDAVESWLARSAR